MARKMISIIDPKKFYEGTIYTANCGDRFKIIEYNNYDNIIIQFLDKNQYSYSVYLSCILDGGVKNPFHPGKYGGYVGDGIYGRKNDTMVYNVWNHMLERVYASKLGYYTDVNSYANTNVCKEWYNFQNFALWYHDYMFKLNPNYVYNLDKDVFQLNLKHKIYSPETCCLIPRELNNRLSGLRLEKTSNLPLGVTFKNGQFYAVIRRRPSTSINLGHYDTPQEAFEAYRQGKLKMLREDADEYYKDNAITKEVYEQIYKLDIHPYGEYDDEEV